MSATLSKLARSDLALIRQRAAPPAEAAAVISGETAVEAAVAALEAAGFLTDASRLMAHALPKREAVWWSCMCAAHTAPAALPDADREACELAAIWVRRQTDEVRRQAMACAQRAGMSSPEAWSAVAAFWSGDSMSPPGQPAVPPADHLTGTAVCGAVALASVRGDPARQAARLRRFLASARDIAAGGAGRLDAEES